MNDINSVIQWIFNVVNTVTDFIAANRILSLLLFVPIVGGFILLVYELFLNVSLSPFNIGGSSDEFIIKSKGFGSVSSKLTLSNNAGFFVNKHRKLKAREAAKNERQAERYKWRKEWSDKLKAEQMSNEYYESKRNSNLDIEVS